MIFAVCYLKFPRVEHDYKFITAVRKLTLGVLICLLEHHLAELVSDVLGAPVEDRH